MSPKTITIVAAADGSHQSRRNLTRAAELASALDAEVVAVYVMSRLAEWLTSLPDQGFSHARECAQELLDQAWTEPLRASGVTYRTQIVAGDPADELAAVAAHEHACFIVGPTCEFRRRDDGPAVTARSVPSPIVLLARDANDNNTHARYDERPERR